MGASPTADPFRGHAMPHADRRASRRDFIKTSAAGVAGVSLAGAAPAGAHPPLAAPVGTATACIFINLVGGPSHLDTFDPKPDAPADVRGPFRPIRTRVPGLHLSELFPKLATVADKFSLIRSMHHDAPPTHEAGLQLLNTGRYFGNGPEWPSALAVAERVIEHNPRVAQWAVFPDLRMETGLAVGHGLGSGWLGERPVWIAEETRRGLSFGDLLTWARGSVEAGPDGCARFITVNQFPTVFDAPSWDCHADRGSLSATLADYRDTVAPSFDTAFAQLLTDLEERGLLETTLVVATGEFGRTPRLNANGGRDHWTGCWTALVAGGGVTGGRVVGASDRTGSAPADRPVTPQELVATVFHALGVPGDATIPGPDGAPVAVYPGAPVVALF